MKDDVIPKDKWDFDNDVTNCFEDMLQRSIPQYDVMRESVFEIGKKFVKNGTYILDLGCSKGSALEPFVEKFKNDNKYIGIEVSEPMLNAAKEKFKEYVENNIVEIKKIDLRHDYPIVNSSLVLSILTLQFVPIEYRQNIVQKIYSNMIEGGALVLVEKVLGNTAEIDNTLVDLYYNTKYKNGYSYEQIERKRLSLEGVLVPITAKWNEEILKNAGFNKVDCFWRFLNFAGWIAIK